jgi:Phytanoyl-CoA dioxygenase (PhyH)/SEC-C motif
MEAGQFHEREHWLALAPGLHIEDRSLFENVGFLELPPELTSRFKHDGYVQGSADWGLDVKLMADTVRVLSAANVSPLFAYLYDEFWYPFLKLHLLHGALLGGGYRRLPDFWILNVDPKKGEAGWRPHRDKGRRALFDDGSPKSVTTWIALTTATPLNGCLYVVPPQHDPTYATAEETEMKFDYQSIRALPADPGDFIIWNQAVFHWGSRTSPDAAESRVSMAFQLQRADVPPFESPLIDPLQVPPFEARVKLIAQQLYRYRHMYELDPMLAQMASESDAETVLFPAVVGAGEFAAQPAGRSPHDPLGRGRIGRNEPCPCGSGKKYKQCHGSLR